MVWSLHALQSEFLGILAWNQRGPGYVPEESYSMKFVCDSTKHWDWLMEDHDEQDIPDMSMGNIQTREASGTTLCSLKNACTIFATCKQVLCCWNMKREVAWSSLGSKTFLFQLLSDFHMMFIKQHTSMIRYPKSLTQLNVFIAFRFSFSLHDPLPKITQLIECGYNISVFNFFSMKQL